MMLKQHFRLRFLILLIFICTVSSENIWEDDVHKSQTGDVVFYRETKPNCKENIMDINKFEININVTALERELNEKDSEKFIETVKTMSIKKMNEIKEYFMDRCKITYKTTDTMEREKRNIIDGIINIGSTTLNTIKKVGKITSFAGAFSAGARIFDFIITLDNYFALTSFKKTIDELNIQLAALNHRIDIVNENVEKLNQKVDFALAVLSVQLFLNGIGTDLKTEISNLVVHGQVPSTTFDTNLIPSEQVIKNDLTLDACDKLNHTVSFTTCQTTVDKSAIKPMYDIIHRGFFNADKTKFGRILFNHTVYLEHGHITSLNLGECDEPPANEFFQKIWCCHDSAKIKNQCNPLHLKKCEVEIQEVPEKFAKFERVKKTIVVATNAENYLLKWANGSSTTHQIDKSGVFDLKIPSSSHVKIFDEYYSGLGNDKVHEYHPIQSKINLENYASGVHHFSFEDVNLDRYPDNGLITIKENNFFEKMKNFFIVILVIIALFATFIFGMKCSIRCQKTHRQPVAVNINYAAPDHIEMRDIAKTSDNIGQTSEPLLQK